MRILRLLQKHRYPSSRFRLLPSCCFSSAADFQKAVSDLSSLKNDVSDDLKLQLYGLYKQSTSGNISGDRPGFTQFVLRAKFDAWKSFEGLSLEEAKEKYVELVEGLKISSSSSDVEYKKGIRVTREGKIYRIELCRPEKYNALTWEGYQGLIDSLYESNKDKETSVTVITGAGKYYCSGNDLSNFTKNVKTPKDMKNMADDGEKILEKFVRAHIEHEKPLISLVNGPAIGIVVTTMALFDLVVASDKATFHTPFTLLGQSPEGCSSYTFPLLMGTTNACEMLLFNKKLTAHDALERNLVTKVIPNESFREESERLVKSLSELPPESLRLNKILIREVNKEKLLDVNIKECKLLKSRWLSSECQEAIQKFMTRK